MNAPFLVPTSTRTLLMKCSSPFFQALFLTKSLKRNQINFARVPRAQAGFAEIPSKPHEHAKINREQSLAERIPAGLQRRRRVIRLAPRIEAPGITQRKVPTSR